MGKRLHGIDCWLVFGAALYWASVAVRHIGPSGDRLAPLDLIGTVGRYALLAALLVLSYAALRKLKILAARISIAAPVLCSGLFLLFCNMTEPNAAPALQSIAAVCDIVTIAAFMLPWGAAFASMDKALAGRNVIVTVLFAVGFILLGALVTSLAPLSSVLFAHIYVVISALVLLSGRVTWTDVARHYVRGLRKEKAFALLQRVTFGTFLGFAFCIGGAAGPREVSYPLLACGALVVAVALVAYLHAPEGLYAGLPALLLTAIAAVYLPFSQPGIVSANALSAVLAWLAWSTLSAFQLSDLKGRFGFSELTLCFADKLAFALALVLGSCLFMIANASGVSVVWGSGTSYALFISLGGLLLGSAYTTARLVSVHEEDQMRTEIDRTRHARACAVYDNLALEFGLSVREREVLEHLAKGHSSVYIKDVMGISDGTVKAHISHIYQKCGVHKKDELLSLIGERLGA